MKVIDKKMSKDGFRARRQHRHFGDLLQPAGAFRVKISRDDAFPYVNWRIYSVSMGLDQLF
jgi:hypothetical protein